MKKYKSLGFWKEHGYVDKPSIKKIMSNQKPLKNIEFEKNYFNYMGLCVSFEPSVGSPSYSLFDGKEFSKNDSINRLTSFDGKWIINSECWNYYKQNIYLFPKEFIEDVNKSQRYPYYIYWWIKMLFKRWNTNKNWHKVALSDSYPKTEENWSFINDSKYQKLYPNSIELTLNASKNFIAKFPLQKLVSLYIIDSDKNAERKLKVVVLKISKDEKITTLLVNTLTLNEATIEELKRGVFDFVSTDNSTLIIKKITMDNNMFMSMRGQG